MKHLVGIVSLFISCVLYCCPYVCSAIYLSNSATYSNELFNMGVDYVGGYFFILSAIFFIVGVVYLVLAELKK